MHTGCTINHAPLVHACETAVLARRVHVYTGGTSCAVLLAHARAHGRTGARAHGRGTRPAVAPHDPTCTTRLRVDSLLYAASNKNARYHVDVGETARLELQGYWTHKQRCQGVCVGGASLGWCKPRGNVREKVATQRHSVRFRFSKDSVTD